MRTLNNVLNHITIKSTFVCYVLITREYIEFLYFVLEGC